MSALCTAGRLPCLFRAAPQRLPRLVMARADGGRVLSATLARSSSLPACGSLSPPAPDPSRPPGNTVALVGLDQFITKNATLCDEKSEDAHTIKAMKFSVR